MPTHDPRQPASWLRRLRDDSILGRILANSSWLLGARAVNAPLAFLESILLARLLGPESYGILGIVLAVVQVLHRLLSFRMSEFVVKYLSTALADRRRDKAGAVLKVALGTEVVTALLALVLIVTTAKLTATSFLGSVDRSGLVRIYSLAVLLSATCEATSGALQVFNKFRLQAQVNVIRKIVLVAGIGLAFFSRASIEWILAIYLGSAAVATLLQLAWTHQAAVTELGKRWWKSEIRLLRDDLSRLIRFAGSVNLGAALAVVVKESDLLWLSFFRPPIEAGFYKLATSLLKIPFAAGSPVTKAVYPELARTVASGAPDELRRLMRQGTQLSAAWVVPVSLLLALLAPWIVDTFYGEGFAPAVAAVWILLAGASIAQIFFWTRPALLALERADVTLKITMLHSLLKIVLAIALVPRFGYLGLASILSLLNLSGVLLSLYFIRDSLRFLAKSSESSER